MALPTILKGEIQCLLIDNFDSFTWNLYQYLALIGVTPVVIRNNAITPAQFSQLNIRSLIISPGPGHPQTDSGISKDAIKYFAGKVPILGVCMGLECLVDLYGGEIAYAGEIMHGKTSNVIHDSRGIMNGLPQGFKSTRYHSLSAHVQSLPDELAVCAVTEENGIVMGVRHREFTIEAVQYHPESIMSEGGQQMLKNFIGLRGGTWDENPQVGVKDVKLPPFSYDVPHPKTTAVTGEDNVIGIDRKPSSTSEQPSIDPDTPPKLPSILQKIYKKRLSDVHTAETTPGTTLEDLRTAMNLSLAPPLISFVDRLKAGIINPPPYSVSSHSPSSSTSNLIIKPTPARAPAPSSTHHLGTTGAPPSPSPAPVPKPLPTSSPRQSPPSTSHSHLRPHSQSLEPLPTPALLAEIKRASPSKGLIAPHVSAPAQALQYALAGASVISVLTEPEWFKGSLQDMLHTRLALSSLPHRPAVLRKDFILSTYQILEARLWGADTVLLIVAMLPTNLLHKLYTFSKSLGMEPLVEVNNEREMKEALDLGAKVVGVNNRNLHTFEVDPETTTRLVGMVKEHNEKAKVNASSSAVGGEPDEVILCALSGIEKRADVEAYVKQGARGMLIGESLMRAKDTKAFIAELLGLRLPLPSCHPRLQSTSQGKKALVKICGIRTIDDALAAARAGADMIGLVFAPGSKRFVTLERAREISLAVRSLGTVSNNVVPTDDPLDITGAGGRTPWFRHYSDGLEKVLSGGRRPLVVGVFQNASLPEIEHFSRVCMLDLIQLHGAEPTEWGRWVSGSGVGVIRVFHVPAKAQSETKVQSIDGPLVENQKIIVPDDRMQELRRPGYHHFVLLDSQRQGDSEGLSGGSGVTLDWDYARGVVDAGEISPDSFAASGKRDSSSDIASSEYPLPIILAGGLTPEKVAEAVQKVHPWCVDVSGGVETSVEGSIGKDEKKIKAFIKAAKGWVDSVQSTKDEGKKEATEKNVATAI